MTGAVHSSKHAKDYRNMGDAQVKRAVQRIIRTSDSEAEVRQRVKDELMCPYTIYLHMPRKGIEGAMFTMSRPDGSTISG